MSVDGTKNVDLANEHGTIYLWFIQWQILEPREWGDFPPNYANIAMASWHVFPIDIIIVNLPVGNHDER